MKLRTEIKIPSSAKKIDHHQKIYFSGSCFSENIAALFNYFGFHVLSNSHGIIYNPVSISEALYDLQVGYEYHLDELFSVPASAGMTGKYFSYLHHGSFSGTDSQVILNRINSNIREHRRLLAEAGFIFITLGSAWVYIEKEKEIIVANCHKIPASRFEKRLLSSLEIDWALESMISYVRAINPLAEIIFTLSPVKHLHDGFVENQLSKSLLHSAIQSCLGTNISYFPAYEIMNDDLRDYRFWKPDMVHPNELALEYILEKFAEVYFTDETLQIMKEVKSVRQMNTHRILSSDENEIKKLQYEQQKRQKEITAKYPQLNL